MEHFALGDYFALIKKWDKVHRIVGKEPIHRLWDQSLAATTTLPAEVRGRGCLIDVGAGAGWIGMAHLFRGGPKAIFIEPDPKKASFILMAATSLGLSTKVQVVMKSLENVSRETDLKEDTKVNFLCARAFSGNLTLQEAWERSQLCELRLFDFRAENTKFFFKELFHSKNDDVA